MVILASIVQRCHYALPKSSVIVSQPIPRPTRTTFFVTVLVAMVAGFGSLRKWDGRRDSNPRPQDLHNCIHFEDKRLTKAKLLFDYSDRAKATWHNVAR